MVRNAAMAAAGEAVEARARQEPVSLRMLLPGRAAELVVQLPSGMLRVVCLHIDPRMTTSAKLEALPYLYGRRLSSSEGLAVMLGDWNYSVGACTHRLRSLAEFWVAHAQRQLMCQASSPCGARCGMNGSMAHSYSVSRPI